MSAVSVLIRPRLRMITTSGTRIATTGSIWVPRISSDSGPRPRKVKRLSE